MLFAERSERERVDKVHDFAQRAVDERAVAADLADSQLGALPEIVIAGFGDRDVELLPYTSLDRAEHLTLALERMVLRDEQREPQNADDHGSGKRRTGAEAGATQTRARSEVGPASCRPPGPSRAVHRGRFSGRDGGLSAPGLGLGR